jgi:cell division protein FtsW (lipid II flippase)
MNPRYDNVTLIPLVLQLGLRIGPMVVFSVEITLSGSHSGNSFEFSHRLTDFLNYALFCLSFCLRLNLKPVNYLKTRRSSMTNSRSP